MKLLGYVKSLFKSHPTNKGVRAIAGEDLDVGDKVSIGHDGRAYRADALKWHWILFTIKTSVAKGEIIEF